MSIITYQKNKHLDLEHYSFIVDQVIKFHTYHKRKRNIGKTKFLKDLSMGTS